jgi:DNA-binding transcriptional LysR family regulator
MDFKQLEMFLEVARRGTFTEAARAMYVSQPTISVQMAALEKELGVQLFERQGRTTTLTPAGKIFMKYAVDITSLAEKSMQAMDRCKTEIAGNIVVCASSVPADYLLPHVLPDFLGLYPKVFVEVVRTHSLGACEEVATYGAELGIVGALGNEREIESLPLVEDEIVVVAPSTGKYSLWDEAISIRSIIEEPLVLRETGSGTYKVFEDALKAKGYDAKKLRFDIRAKMHGAEAVKAAVAAGLGLGIVSNLVVEKEVSLGLLRKFTIKDLDLRRKFYIITHRNKVLSPPAEKLKESMVERVK